MVKDDRSSLKTEISMKMHVTEKEMMFFGSE
jgi:hypothetical protein